MDEIEPRRAVTADEVDAHSRWRHVLHWHPGELAAAKARTNRRERRLRRRETQKTLREETG